MGEKQTASAYVATIPSMQYSRPQGCTAGELMALLSRLLEVDAGMN
jgi:hypothetical protein